MLLDELNILLNLFLFVLNFHVHLNLTFLFLIDLRNKFSDFLLHPVQIILPSLQFIVVFVFLVEISDGFSLNTTSLFKSSSLSFQLFDFVLSTD